MRASSFGAWLLALAMVSGAATQEPEKDIPFWLVPNAEIDLTALKPAAIVLVAAPDERRGFAVLQTGTTGPVVNFVPSNPEILPFLPAQDSGYEVIYKGLKVGATTYGDRKYKITELPDVFSGLTLVQTKAGHKGIVDGRYAIVLSGAKPSLAFVAVDERAIDIYKEHGVPAWLQEFAPTGHKIKNDDPIMAPAGARYDVFVRKTASGRIVLGAPSMDISLNSMYFAFFAEDAGVKAEKEAK
jgi:hypothetical protein